jgi:hypothetical protein
MAARDQAGSRIRDLNLYRYWVVSLLYVLSLAIAVCCFGAVPLLLIFGKPSPLPPDLYRALGLFFTGGASGGIGAFLIRIDQEERKNIRLDQLLDTLSAAPNPDLTSLERVISSYLGFSPGSLTTKKNHSPTATEPFPNTTPTGLYPPSPQRRSALPQ